MYAASMDVKRGSDNEASAVSINEKLTTRMCIAANAKETFVTMIATSAQ